jgi:hypothetical protein
MDTAGVVSPAASVPAASAAIPPAAAPSLLSLPRLQYFNTQRVLAILQPDTAVAFKQEFQSLLQQKQIEFVQEEGNGKQRHGR